MPARMRSPLEVRTTVAAADANNGDHPTPVFSNYVHLTEEALVRGVRERLWLPLAASRPFSGDGC